MAIISKGELERLYLQEKKSVKDVADFFGVSSNKIIYWMEKYDIRRRTISDAIYLKNNPFGDPFLFRKPKNLEEAVLFGMGIGLYWGEGTKANRYSIRLGNTDPELIKTFIRFLNVFFSIKTKDLRFGLQIFSDTPSSRALAFWSKKLGISIRQFYKVTITRTGLVGTYKKKSEHGVLTIYFHNKKSRDLLVGLLPIKDNRV